MAIDLMALVARLGLDSSAYEDGLARARQDFMAFSEGTREGLSTAERTYVRALQLGEKSDRSRIRTLSANHAFDMLRRCILGLPVE